MVEQLFTARMQASSGTLLRAGKEGTIVHYEEGGTGEKTEAEKRRWGERGENDETEDTMATTCATCRSEREFFILAGILAPYSQPSEAGE